ncbi:DUF5686 family protein [Sphingobacterium sp. HJSM2_6]|uniref:DUF5686 and carboxypeptidase-like regulatory domain-containing protein n=1 Tax=Sphingobacterium sp. HJSM2_6 TaxID=3366264 RepID=UPI003BDB1667
MKTYILRFTFFLLLSLQLPLVWAQQTLHITGKVFNADSYEPIPYATVTVLGGDKNLKTTTNANGEYTMNIPNSAKAIRVSSIGFSAEEYPLNQDPQQNIRVMLFPSNSIEEIVVTAPRRLKYSNKNNPAVELIRKVVEHRDENRLTGQKLAEFDQYEKISLGLSNLDAKFKNKKIFKKYQFLFQEDDSTNSGNNFLLPAYMEEKFSKVYYRKDPNAKKQYILAERKAEFDPKFVDNDGLSKYFNRLYDEVEIYDNNIHILTNQFLSPIANSAPTFYRYYITDTIKTSQPYLVELSFFPRNKADLLFKGKLYITLDGQYAVQRAEMTVNDDINLNFVRDLAIELAFKKNDDQKYYLSKSSLGIDFSITDKGKGIKGKRVVLIDKYQNGIERPDSIYQVPDKYVVNQELVKPKTEEEETLWANMRLEPLQTSEKIIYENIDSLQQMPSFRTFMDISTLIFSGYKQAGPLEIGPVNTFYSYNPVEGFRLRVGGRTTDRLSKRFYMEGYGAYGFEDQKWKYFLSGTYSLNNKSIYKFPQHYVRISASYDTKIPGQNLEFIQEDNVLLSFKRGENKSYLYNEVYRLDYKVEFSNNFSVNAGLATWKQNPAGVLAFRLPQLNGAFKQLNEMKNTEFNIGFRYAPNEEYFQGKLYRTPIVNQYPILSFNYAAGIKDLFGGESAYHNFTAGVFKRLYLSQLGYADINVDGTYILGDNLSFPVLNIHRANQTYAYQLQSYNLMNFMEFISDKHASLNVQYYMNGFLFNKIPLLKKLKLREVFSFKGVYGSLRASNNPSLNNNIYAWQVNNEGQQTSYTFGNKPYMEASAGVANIFKILRVDVVKRLNYLDHPDAPAWGVRARVKFDF